MLDSEGFVLGLLSPSFTLTALRTEEDVHGQPTEIVRYLGFAASPISTATPIAVSSASPAALS